MTSLVEIHARIRGGGGGGGGLGPFLTPGTPISPLGHNPGNRIKISSDIFFYLSLVRTYKKSLKLTL